MKFALLFFLLIVILGAIRSFWRNFQVKRAVRKAFADTSIDVLKINSTAVFSGYESIPAAFLASFTIYHYGATCRLNDGTERIFDVVANFHPIMASLRDIDVQLPIPSHYSLGFKI